MRGQKGFGLMLGIAIAAIVIVAMAATGTFGAIYSLLAGPKHCSEDAYASNCYCGTDELKVGFMPWSCEERPQAVPYTLPIETWEEAYSFAGSSLGVGVSCTGEYFIEQYASGELPRDGEAYGYPYVAGSHYIDIECKKVTSTYPDGEPQTAVFAWRIAFDPMDGFIYYRGCDEAAMESCPAYIPWRLK